MIDNYKISLNLFKSNSYLILLSQLSKLFGGIGSIKFLFINLSQ